MLMDLSTLIDKHGLKIRGVLHGGAHLAEEAQTYADLDVGPVWWVEGNPAVIPTIQRTLSHYAHQQVIQALLHERDGEEVDFHVTNYDGMSSSIFQFGTHPQFSPDTVFVDHLRLRTSTIDTLAAEHNIVGNLVNLDLQGAELLALRGGRQFLDQVDQLILEVNRAEVYIGCAQVHQLDQLLDEHGFTRVETSWVPGQDWGDALYIRRWLS